MAKRILVQAGHMAPRQPGFESGTGAPGEIELVADIRQALCRLLERDDRFDAVPVPGRIPGGLQVDAALFLHADGSGNPAVGGYSLGFPVFDVNRRLAQMIAKEFEKIPGCPDRRPDNNTADMAGYYGYRHVETPGPEVLVEHGFVTNPQEHQWLRRNVDELARAEYTALCRLFGFNPQAVAQERAGGGDGVTPRTVTPQSALLAAPRAPKARAVRHLLAREHGEYTDADVRMIVGRYWDTAPAVGLDPLVVVAQMVLETGGLTSFWSQRPRRNPAGIGVTGEPGVGLSFPDWATAVRAHAGRLLAYALPRGEGNAAQKAMIEEALAFRPLPDQFRGAAPTLRGLVGRWAMDPRYAAGISRVANEIAGDSG
jgi:hypothetical protein